MNLFVAVAFLAFGELANLLLVSLSVCSILGGVVRKRLSGNLTAWLYGCLLSW